MGKQGVQAANYDDWVQETVAEGAHVEAATVARDGPERNGNGADHAPFYSDAMKPHRE